MSDTHGHGGGSHETALPFTDAQWQEFREADKEMGKHVVLLMVGIFSIGLALYVAIAWICSSG
jgi:hypothetical protein